MKKQADFDRVQLRELLHQALETERGGIKVYETALQCAVNEDLRKEWKEYLEQTRRHEQVLLQVFEQLGLDANERTPGQEVVGLIGESLVQAMTQAQSAGDPVGAELTACECVVLAETKDHQNWELIGQVARHGKGQGVDALKAAHDEVEHEEDHHLYHSKGWCRELWLDALGFEAVLPPPEEVRQVETAIGAARAEQGREQLT
jgi:rubrerythrin